MFCTCRPLFNACMPRFDPDFKPISSLSGLDEEDPNRAGYNFRHVAFVYQLYMRDSSVVDESDHDRSRRIKILTKMLATIVEEGLSMYKVCLAQPFLTHS